MANLVAIGKIYTTFGLEGGVKVYPYADRSTFEHFENRQVWIGNERIPVRSRILSARWANKNYLVEFDGFDSIEKAKRITGKSIYVDESELPPVKEGEYYFFQIVGAEVYDEDGLFLGKVKEIIQTGANDVFVVEGDEELLIPSVEDYIVDMDIEHSRITVRKMEWY